MRRIMPRANRGPRPSWSSPLPARAPGWCRDIARRCNIFAVTPHDTTTRQLSVNYGVTPVLAPDVSSTDEMLAHMDRVMVEGGYLEQGQLVVFLAGQPVGRPGTTNLMKLHRVGVA